MNFIQFGKDDRQKFNDYVASQTTGSFLQSWEWGDFQKSFYNKKVFRFGVERDGQLIIAGQGIETKLFLNKTFLYFPYGPVMARDEGEGLREATDLEFFVSEIKKQFRNALFVRIEPRLNPSLIRANKRWVKTLPIQPSRTLLLNLNKTQQELLAEMHPKTRYNIRLAEKHGVVVDKEFSITNGHGLFFDEAINLIVQTAKRQGYVGHSKKYYQSLVDYFALHHTQSSMKVGVYKAHYQNQLLASAIVIDFEKTRTYLFGGSSDTLRNVMAPYALHFQAIIDAKQAGMNSYDFDGLEQSIGKEASFARFKQGFGGEIVNFAGAYDIIYQKFWYQIYKLGRKLNRLIKHL